MSEALQAAVAFGRFVCELIGIFAGPPPGLS